MINQSVGGPHVFQDDAALLVEDPWSHGYPMGPIIESTRDDHLPIWICSNLNGDSLYKCH